MRIPVSPARPCRGFTLVELLVVIGLVGILLGLLIPAVQQARASAGRLSCRSRVRQIGIGLHGYHDTRGGFPPGMDNRLFGTRDGTTVSWLSKILPYVEQEAVYADIRRAYAEDADPRHNPPHTGLATVIQLYTCPADSRLAYPQSGPTGPPAAFTSYLGMRGSHPAFPEYLNGVLPVGFSVRIADVPDGTSNTVMVGERPPSARLDSGWWYTYRTIYSHDFLLTAVTWMHDNECIPPVGGEFVFGPGRLTNQCDLYHFWSLHTGGANFLFADGSVRFLPYKASPILRALASRNGGETVEVP